jgi:hypothetical protein
VRLIEWNRVEVGLSPSRGSGGVLPAECDYTWLVCRQQRLRTLFAEALRWPRGWDRSAYLKPALALRLLQRVCTVCHRGAGSQGGGNQGGLGQLCLGRADLLGLLGMDFDAVGTLRRESHGDRH